MKTQRLARLIGKRVVVERPGLPSVNGWLGLSGNGLNYAVWDGGDSVRFDDDKIDFVEINFVHLKAGPATSYR